MLDSSQLMNNIGGYVSRAPVVGVIAKNPFYTALLICLICMICVVVVFRNADCGDESVGRLAFRAGVYSLLFVTGIQFLQNQHVLSVTNDSAKNTRTEEIFKGGSAVTAEERVKVVPVAPTKNAELPKQEATPANTQGELFVPVGIDVSFI